MAKSNYPKKVKPILSVKQFELAWQSGTTTFTIRDVLNFILKAESKRLALEEIHFAMAISGHFKQVVNILNTFLDAPIDQRVARIKKNLESLKNDIDTDMSAIFLTDLNDFISFYS